MPLGIGLLGELLQHKQFFLWEDWQLVLARLTPLLALALMLLFGAFQSAIGQSQIAIIIIEHLIEKFAGDVIEPAALKILKSRVCNNPQLRSEISPSVLSMLDCDTAPVEHRNSDLRKFEHAPSFPCAKASTAAELLICRDTALTELDVILHDSYRTALSRVAAEDQERLRQGEREWMQERDACAQGRDVLICLGHSYQRRISELATYYR